MFSVVDEKAIFNQQRTPQGVNYERTANEIRRILRSSSAKDIERAKALNDAILKIRGVSPSSVHSNAITTSLSVQYANDMYIGDRLIPYVPVSKRSDAFAIYTKRDRFGYPDDSLNSRSRASELNETRTTSNYSVLDYGFQNFVSAETIEAQDAAFDEMFDLIEAINEGIAFMREKRLATILCATANYATGNYATLSGSDQWNHSSGGDPVGKIQDAIAALWSGRGATKTIMWSGLEVYNVLAKHQAIRDLFKYNETGLATRQQIAAYFGCDDYLVGAAREDTANAGQTASYSRIWGKHFGVTRVMARPSLRMAAFGALFRMKSDPVTTQWFDAAVGRSGGYYAKVAVAEDAKVIANDAGYLYRDAVA